MKSCFRPTTISDLAAVRRLLQLAFNTSEDSPLLDPRVMAWKYWDQRDDWKEPRAYVLEREGRVIAHAAIYPVTFAAGQVKGIQMLDWASASDSPGAGLTLLQKLTAMFDFVYSIGGSEMTRKILPAYGFVEYARQWRGARPLRPFSLTVTHQQHNWKLAPRLARNFLWSRPVAREDRVPNGWKVQEMAVANVDGSYSEKSAVESYFSPRPAGFFEYLLRCPVMPVRLYEIRNENEMTGHFALGTLRGQARVAGIWLRHPDAMTWQTAFTLAQCAAAKLKGAYELAVAGTEGTSEQSATQSGIRILGRTPIYLLNKKGKLALPRDFQFQLSDDDAFFMNLGGPSYWT